MHKFSTAPTKSSGVRCAPPALHSVGLLNVPYSTFAGASVVRGETHSGRRFRRLRDENLCIIRASKILSSFLLPTRPSQDMVPSSLFCIVCSLRVSPATQPSADPWQGDHSSHTTASERLRFSRLRRSRSSRRRRFTAAEIWVVLLGRRFLRASTNTSTKRSVAPRLLAA